MNEFLESSVPGIFAASDVAAAVHPVMGSRLRIEHWDNAKRQGPAAARNMLGQATAYARIPFSHSDQYDLNMEYSGHATDWDRVAVRGDITRREFLAFWLKDGRVLAGLNANVDGVNPTIARLVAGGRPVAIARLEDPRVPQEELEAVAEPGQGKAPRPGRRLQPGTTPGPRMSRGPEEGKLVVPQRVGPAGAVGPRRMKAFGVGGKQVTVANVGGRLYASDDTCTHRGCSLAEGVLDGTTVECACHGSRFDVTTGTVLRGPATEPVRSHAVRVEGADLLVEARAGDPGDFVLFQWDPVGDPIHIADSLGLDSWNVPVGSKVHSNWAFTAPGTYAISHSGVRHVA